jgi:hypothetical protein
MSVSTDQSFDSNKPDLEKMILEHISERISDMKPGEVTDCEGLFNPWVPMSMPMPVTEPGPVPMLSRAPVRHGGACKCDEEAKINLLDLTSPQIALMAPGDECESKDLFVRECWDSLSHAHQIAVGQCIVCLVAQGVLPLENLGASPRSANHVIYRKL